jgi:16S rRNA (uracil1498-N3)-methyltransferase
MDYIIQKATELGVKKIVPVITERSQVRHTQKAGRWRKIAFSASQQSGRDKIPEVVEPLILEKFLNTLPQVSAKEGTLRLIFSESQEERNMKKVLSRFKGLHSVMLLIGPEGGFSQEEIILSVEQGFIDVSLGPRILRAETAPVTAISIIQYELGDIG